MDFFQQSECKLTFGVFKIFSGFIGVRQQVWWRGFMRFHRGEWLVSLSAAPRSSKQQQENTTPPRDQWRITLVRADGCWLCDMTPMSCDDKGKLAEKLVFLCFFSLLWMRNGTWRGSSCDVCISMGALFSCFCHYTIKEVLASSDAKDLTWND